MIAVSYTSDLAHHVKTLLVSREMNPDLIYSLPEYGVIVLDKSGPIAAGFLRRIEGSMGMLDSYITNPLSLKEDRQIALRLVTKHLVNVSETLGIHKLIAFTNAPTIHEALIEQGLYSYDYSFFIRNGV